MESPGGIPTNIYRIATLSAIQWIIFAPLPTPSNDGLKLHFIEALIRRNGGHVYREPTRDRLWLFDLNQTFPKDGKFSSHQDIIDFAISCNLQEIKCGIVMSEAKYGSENPRREINAFGKRTRSHESVDTTENDNGIYEAASREDLEGPDRPREFLSQAVQTSAIAGLVRLKRYIALGSNLFCSYNQLDNEHGISSRKPSRSISHAMRRLSILWDQTGAMLLFYNKVKDKFVSTIDNAQTPRHVFLAPFGWLAQTATMFSNSDNRPTNMESWRQNCLELLYEHDMVPQDVTSWTSVRLPAGSLGSVPGEIQWPTEFCFMVAQKPASSKLVQHQSNPLIDMLDIAEDWLINGQAKEKLVREQLAARSKYDDASVSSDESDYIPAHLQTKHDEVIDYPSVNGIYPTPPEATRIHGAVASDYGPAGSTTTDGQDNTVDHATPALDASIRIKNYDPFKDDLFAEVEDEIAGENGVTEDDFRFFDEPDDVNMMSPEQMITEEEEEEAILHSESALDVMEGLAVLDPISEVTAAGHALLEDPMPNDTMQKDTKTKVEIVEIPTVISYDASDSDASTHSPEPMDDKYASFGKFGDTNMIGPSTTRPDLGVAPQARKQIPHDLVLTPSSSATPAEDSMDIVEALANEHEESRNNEIAASHLKSLLQNATPDFDPLQTSGVPHQSKEKSSAMAPSRLENNDHSMIQLAQIVADQAPAFAYLINHISRGHDSMTEDSELISSDLDQLSLNSQAMTINECASLDLGAGGTKPIQLPTPFIKVRRGDSVMEMSCLATRFWKELGLRPLHQAKDVVAFCLFEDSEPYPSGYDSFLQCMESSWSSLNLGRHTAGHPQAGILGTRSMLPVRNVDSNNSQTDPADDFCTSLGKELSTLPIMNKTIVLYMVEPQENDNSLVKLCTLFQTIFGVYAANIDFNDQSNDIVLQIVPRELALSGLTGVLVNHTNYNIISRIVYDRCPSEQDQVSAYMSASAIQLAEPIPATINFKLSADNTTNAFSSSESMHLAISFKQGDSWLSAALTDASSSKQWTATYCLGEYTASKPALTAIAKEIWSIMREASDYRKTTNVYMLKSCRWSAQEVDIWKSLAQEYRISLAMVVYDEDCPIDLHPKSNSLDSDAIKERNPVPSTPDVSSPDASGATVEESDSVSRLVDTHDQSWWFSTPDLLTTDHNSHPTTQHHISSGYLVNRGQKIAGLYVQESTHTMELDAIVVVFHGLRTLAQVRFVDDDLPWHLAVADRAQQTMLKEMVGWMKD